MSTPQAEDRAKLVVIGAGFGRTGTLSLKLALDKLGFGPTHHMVEVFGKQQIPLWMDVLDGRPNWEAIYGKYKSAVDFPTCTWYEELMQLYPDAVVVLTVRDSPEKWYESVKDTIFKDYIVGRSWITTLDSFFFRREYRSFRTFLDRMVLKQFGSYDAFRTPESLQLKYLEHIEQVKRTVPKGKLLVMNAKEGWKPLCTFLKVPEPQEPYPLVNESAQFKARVAQMNQQAIRRMTVVCGVISILGWVTWKLATKNQKA